MNKDFNSQTAFDFVGEIDKQRLEELESEAIEFLKQNEPTEGYLLGFSGGKDSQVIYELAKMSGVKFQPYYSITTVDQPELIYFIRKNYPDVKFVRPKYTMWGLIKRNKIAPTRLMRFCCRYLKETVEGKVIIGVRTEESRSRSLRYATKINHVSRKKILYAPIADWTEYDVWAFHKKYNLKHCELYDLDYTRLGCIGCPFSGKRRILEISRYPRYYRLYFKAFKHVKSVESGQETLEDFITWWLETDEWKKVRIAGTLVNETLFDTEVIYKKRF